MKGFGTALAVISLPLALFFAFTVTWEVIFIGFAAFFLGIVIEDASYNGWS